MRSARRPRLHVRAGFWGAACAGTREAGGAAGYGTAASAGCHAGSAGRPYNALRELPLARFCRRMHGRWPVQPRGPAASSPLGLSETVCSSSTRLRQTGSNCGTPHMCRSLVLEIRRLTSADYRWRLSQRESTQCVRHAHRSPASLSLRLRGSFRFDTAQRTMARTSDSSRTGFP